MHASNMTSGKTVNGVFSVNTQDIYTEPVVFSVNGDSLTLQNYRYAYGNRMSDAINNPFTVVVT